MSQNKYQNLDTDLTVWKCCKTYNDILVYVKMLVPINLQMIASNACIYLEDGKYICPLQHSKVLEIVDENEINYTLVK